MAGGRIDIEVAPDLRQFPAKLKSGLSGVGGIASSIGKGLGLAIAGGTAIAAVGIKNIIQLGNEYTANLNEMQAVSGATADEMAKVGSVAKALGGDLTLPATSAADAAAAMVELTKGGLSVAEAMDAAKGTLQLAAAAQVDGATAAEIQSSALNAFGLSADQAGKVADVLANTANAAAGSMVDIGNSLKYVAPVAAALKVPIEDTASAIGLLANQGVKGEQAGTSLRGILASLASPSAAAAEALNALGVEAFDAQGKFIGLRAFTDQLAQAKGRLTDAEFAAAASTAFGNEGLTAANALAAEGTAGFDSMATAVSRAGGAAEVAAARTKGLGGAWEGFKSQLETAGIGIYEVIAPPLERATRAASNFVADFTPKVISGIRVAVAAGELFGPGLAQAMRSKIGDIQDVAKEVLGPLADGIKDSLNSAVNIGITVFGGFADVVGEAADAVVPLATGVGDLVEGLNEADGPIAAAGAGLGLVYDAAGGLVSVLAPVAELVGTIASEFGDLPGPIQSAAVALLLLNVGPSILGGLKSAFSGAKEEAGEAGRQTGLLGRAVGTVLAPVRAAAAGVGATVGVLRQFNDEARVQQQLAGMAGEQVGRLGGAAAAFNTSAVPAVATARRFRDQLDGVRAGAAGAYKPVGLLGAAIGVFAERSATVASARNAYQKTFDSVAASADRAAISVGVATESLGTTLRTAATRSGQAVGNVASSISGLSERIRFGFSLAAETVADRAAGIASSVRAIPTAVGVAALSVQDRVTGMARSVGEAFAGIPAKIAAFPTAVGVGVIGTLDKIPGAVAGSVSAMGRFGAAAAGVASAAGSLVRSAGTGLVSALGGPWGIAIAGAGVLLSVLAANQQEAAQAAADHKNRIRELADTLDQSTGAITAETRALATKQLAEKGLINSGRQLGISADTLVSASLGQADALGIVREQLIGAARDSFTNGEAFDEARSKLEGYGITTDDIIGAVSGNGAALARVKAAADAAGISFADLGLKENNNLAATLQLGIAMGVLGGNVDEARGVVEQTAAAMTPAAVATQKFRDKVAVLGDATADADTKARALKDALDALSGGQLSLEKANAQLNERLAGLADLFGENLDKTKGWGQELLNADGSINTVTENGRGLLESMDGISESMASVAQKTFDAAIAQGDTMPVALDKAKQAAQGALDTFLAQGDAMGLTAEQVQALADRYGLVPSDVATLITAPGMDETQLELLLLKQAVDAVPPNKAVKVDSLSDAAKQKLLDIGFTVNTLPDGSVEVIANTANAKTELDNYIKSNSGRTIPIRVVTTYETIVPGTSGQGGRHFAGNATGGVVAAAYANGGIHKQLTPMKGGIAKIVPPNTWRVVGDRLRDDEFYIPDDDSPRSMQIGLEWARRRGLVLARKFAEGGLATTGRTTEVPQLAPAGTVVNMPISVQDNRSAYEVARVASSQLAFAARFGG